MYKIGIVDDETKIIERISEFVKKVLDERAESYQLETSTSPDKFLQDYKEGFDILFFDVMMDGMDGIELAKRIRKIDANVTIVFITLMARFAINGYEVGAYDYILKPVEYDDFYVRFNRILLHANKRKIGSKSVVLKNVKSMRILSCNEILYVESGAHYVTYHTFDESIKQRGKLKDVFASIDDGNFAFCNQCYLVNLNYIERVDDSSVHLSNGEQLLISRQKKKPFLAAVSAHYLRR